MKRNRILQVLLTIVLAGALFFLPLSAGAAELFPTQTTEPTETTPLETNPEEPAPALCLAGESERPASTPDGQWNLYFGLLHAHSDSSDGTDSVEALFADAAGRENLDFFAVTDQSNALDNADTGAITEDGTQISAQWARGKTAAAGVTESSFVGIYGYEMAWQEVRELGHISTFRTPGWQSREQEAFSTLESYYEALASVPGSVSQFNHPGPEYGTFEKFAHARETYAHSITLLEITGEGIHGSYRWYPKALDAGWRVAPTLSQDIRGCGWDDTGARTVLLAEALTENGLYEAMLARRVYATEDPDLCIDYRLDGCVMGSGTEGAQEHTVSLWFRDASDGEAATVEVIADGGAALLTRDTVPDAVIDFAVPGGYSYYYLRITQADGDRAVTAPVWTDTPEAPAPTEPTPPPETEPPETQPLPEDTEWNAYRGQLHAHSTLSDGDLTPEALFAAAKGQMDFFALTEHSNSFDNHLSGAIDTDGAAVSEKWAAGTTAAREASSAGFVGFFGYEMTWPDQEDMGHIATLNTPGWQNRDQEGFDSLEPYYDALSSAPDSVSQFCHPGQNHGEFQNFSHYSAKRDAAMHLLEICSEDSFTGSHYYTKALDAGWHIAPSISENNHSGAFGEARTVVLAKALTKESLLDAIRANRVWASQDRDLSVIFRMDGAIMGSVLECRDTHTITARLSDPTDSAIGTVEVVTDGGKILLVQQADSPEAWLEFSVPGGNRYYYLQITQPDGDTAITAPVWTEDYTDMGIGDFLCDTALPVQGAPLSFSVSLFNEENINLQIQRITLYREDTALYSWEEGCILGPGDTFGHSISLTCDTVGTVRYRISVSGTTGGAGRSFESTLHVTGKPPEVTADIWASGFAGDGLDSLTAIARGADMRLEAFSGLPPRDGDILILSAAQAPYSEDFLENVLEFTKNGGNLILCGGDNNDAANALLEYLGSTLRLRSDRALDEVCNGGDPELLTAVTFNTDSRWCTGLTRGQIYHHQGSTVDPGEGIFLVKGRGTTVSSQTGLRAPVLLAAEETAYGGVIFVSGGSFLSDNVMPLPQSRWDLPTGNQTILETLLGMEQKQLPASAIADVREGSAGTVYRIRGWATSGTSNPFNTFPQTLYLQDDTGGIPILEFPETGIEVGTPLEVMGCLGTDGKNPALIWLDHRTAQADRYRYVPQTMDHLRAMDFETRGGQLLQIEGTVISLTLTEDGKGISRFTLEDLWGDRATVLIEPYIASGAYGTNTLADQVKVGKRVRAMGLLHLDSNGIPVLRVRNCEEVVRVDPIPEPKWMKKDLENPPTGDTILWKAAVFTLSGVALLVYLRKKKRSGT